MTEKSDKQNNRLKVLLIIVIIAFIGSFYIPYSPLFLPYLVENTIGCNNYIIKVSGLEDLTTSGETTIMIPIPTYIDGEPVFSDTYLERVNTEREGVYRMNSSWNLSVEETPCGNMMVFRSSERRLSNLDMILAEFDRKSEPRLLMPAVIVTKDLTLKEFSTKEYGKYESCIYIDGIFDSTDKPIKFELRYIGGGEKKYMFKADTWKSSLSTSLLSGNTGYSNVSVNYVVTDY